MSLRRRIVILFVWILSLVGVAAWAQSPKRPGGGPEIISGSDIGFQVDRSKGDTPVGSLVVRRDGKWVEVEFSGRMKIAR
jgi:hypothetical protein